MKHSSESPRPHEVALAKQIEVEMVEHDLSQGKLAEAIGISRGAMNRYLNNHRTFDYGQIVDIAEVFGLTAGELIRRAESRLH